MHEDTGRIVREDEIPKKDKKKYVPIVPTMFAALSAMTPDERVQQLALERRTEHREKLSKQFFEPARGNAKKRAKRKAQKLSRRKNRK